METLITVLHVIVAAFLILVVLLQSGQADMGTSFGGGGSNSVLGSAGANKFMTRLTGIAAAVFMFTSISLTILGGGEAGSSSVVEDVEEPAATQPVQSAPDEAAPEGGEETSAEEAPAADAEAEGEMSAEGADENADAAPEASEAPTEDAAGEQTPETPAQAPAQ